MSLAKSLLSHLKPKSTNEVNTNLCHLEIPNIKKPLKILTHDKHDTVISERIKKDKIWEPGETTLMTHLVKPGDTFVDVGANIGYFSILAGRLTGENGQVIAFEPERENFSLLEYNIKLNNLDHVTAAQLALSSESGTADLYLNKNNLGDHQLFPSKNDSTRTTSKITLALGDDQLADIKQIDFLKVDTQGSEYHVLKGLSSVIARSLPEMILLLEYTPNALRDAGIAPLTLLELLTDWNFNFYILTNSRLAPISHSQLEDWVNISALDRSSDGFTNILCTSAQKKIQLGWQELELSEEDALDILLGDPLCEWDGRPCNGSHIGKYLYFKHGWDLHLWMNEDKASMLFKPRGLNAHQAIKLIIQGAYKENAEPMRLRINGELIGEFMLEDAEIVVPSSLFLEEKTTIEFSYISTPPKIKFGFKHIAWQACPPAKALS